MTERRVFRSVARVIGDRDRLSRLGAEKKRGDHCDVVSIVTAWNRRSGNRRNGKKGRQNAALRCARKLEYRLMSVECSQRRWVSSSVRCSRSTPIQTTSIPGFRAVLLCNATPSHRPPTSRNHTNLCSLQMLSALIILHYGTDHLLMELGQMSALLVIITVVTRKDATQ